jgi:hypothetical protein
MSVSKTTSRYTVRVDNVYFLSRVGLSLRWATEGVAREDLSADVRRLLAQLDELEAQELAEPAASPRRAEHHPPTPPSDRLQREP